MRDPGQLPPLPTLIRPWL